VNALAGAAVADLRKIPANKAKAYLKTAERLRQKPWCMDKGADYLQKWVRGELPLEAPPDLKCLHPGAAAWEQQLGPPDFDVWQDFAHGGPKKLEVKAVVPKRARPWLGSVVCPAPLPLM
jgi:hypothetical protein